MRVNDRRSAPFVEGIFEQLIPAEATSWLAGFYAWTNSTGGFGYNHAYFRVAYRGSDYLSLAAYAESETRAVAIMQWKILRDC